LKNTGVGWRAFNQSNPKEKPMRKMMVVVAVAVLSAGTLFAAEKDDVLGVVKQALEAFNRGDVKAVFGLCLDDFSIHDNIAPYEWHGPGAFQKWCADYDADAKKKELTDGVVTFGKAKHMDVTGDRAYLVASGQYTYKQHGKPKKVSGTWVFTLQKTNDGWRITGWTWAES
jgi:ketosteroid isomerase-like protein